MILLKLIAVNLATILFLSFTIWSLKNGHPKYAAFSFIIAACSVVTDKALDKKDKKS